MTVYEHAQFACILIVVFVIVPYVAMSAPAMMQMIAGDYSAVYALNDQGWHWLGIFSGTLIILILAAGRALE